jgi:hypothetical protein
MEVKVRILSKCKKCDGRAYLQVGEEVDYKGDKYTRFSPCSECEGTGVSGQWVDLPEFFLMLEQSKCSHQHVSRMGGFHFTAGDVWDDIQDICDDCGQVLR